MNCTRCTTKQGAGAPTKPRIFMIVTEDKKINKTINRRCAQQQHGTSIKEKSPRQSLQQSRTAVSLSTQLV
jgi:hypothetical protein